MTYSIAWMFTGIFTASEGRKFWRKFPAISYTPKPGEEIFSKDELVYKE